MLPSGNLLHIPHFLRPPLRDSLSQLIFTTHFRDSSSRLIFTTHFCDSSSRLTFTTQVRDSHLRPPFMTHCFATNLSCDSTIDRWAVSTTQHHLPRIPTLTLPKTKKTKKFILGTLSTAWPHPLVTTHHHVHHP